MAMVYLAELGHDPSFDFAPEGVSFSLSGPGNSTLQMRKFLAHGQINEYSIKVTDPDNIDDAVDTLLTRYFGDYTRLDEKEKVSEVFLMDPVFIDIDDSISNLATKNTETALDELGYGLTENTPGGTRLQLFFIKLKASYWLGMLRIENSKVVRGAHKKIKLGEDLDVVIYSLVNKAMSLNTNPKNLDAEMEDDDIETERTHDALCPDVSSAGSTEGFFAALYGRILCELSDYTGIEVAMGGKDLYGNWYPNAQFGFIWGFSDNHAWIWGLDYAGTMGYTKSRWAWESIHRFSQEKGLFADVVWGWGYDRTHEGWYVGADIGYNVFVSGSKAHWLSLMLRYDWTFDESWTDGSRISASLVYNLRGYFRD